MGKYKIRYGLGGGFGGCENREWEEIEAESLGQAEKFAFEAACDEYEAYDGMYGLMSFDDIREENPEWDDDEVKMEWIEQREGWLDYEAKKA